jgi:hypothetical protein
VPRGWRDALDAAALHAATKPLTDPEHLCTTCYRCATVSAGVTAARRRAGGGAGGGVAAGASATPPPPVRTGDRCPACDQAYVRCMITFDVLPLVEFDVPDAAPEAVLRVLEQGGRVTSSSTSASAATAAAGGRPGAPGSRPGAGQDVLHFDAADAGFGSGFGGGGGLGGGAGSGAAGAKAFNALLQDATALAGGGGGGGSGASSSSSSTAVACPMRVLEQLRPSEVFVTGRGKPSQQAAVGSSVSSAPPRALRFWKNVIPDIGVACCPACDAFFAQQEHEFEALKAGGACPACRYKPGGSAGGSGSSAGPATRAGASAGSAF